MLRTLIAATLGLALLASAARACDYEAAPGDAYESYVAPIHGAVNIRRAGPDSEVAAKLEPSDEAVVMGACGDWLEITSGFKRGWVSSHLVCQFNVRWAGSMKTWFVAELCKTGE